jgi:hypothetical protein
LTCPFRTPRPPAGQRHATVRAVTTAQIPDDPIEAVIGAVVDEPSAANVYVVGAGWGDGRYAIYVGHGADGPITTFVTVFRVMPLPWRRRHGRPQAALS